MASLGPNTRSLIMNDKQNKNVAGEKRENDSTTSRLSEEVLEVEVLEERVAPLIMLNGDLLPCCFMDRSPYSICTEWYAGVHMDVPFHQYRMGNIFETNFKELWNNSDFRLLRKTIRDSETKIGLTIDNFNRKRQTVNMETKYSYCRACLFRWNAAC